MLDHSILVEHRYLHLDYEAMLSQMTVAVQLTITNNITSTRTFNRNVRRKCSFARLSHSRSSTPETGFMVFEFGACGLGVLF